MSTHEPTLSPQMPKVAIIVLNYNTPEMTNTLAHYLIHDLNYPCKKVYVIDNGSDEPPASTTHRLPKNLGFTRGMHEGYLLASCEDEFDAYWFLNSDLDFEHGNDVLLDLVDVLFSSESFAQIAPQHNSPHAFMEHAEIEAQPVPYLQPTATLIKASTIKQVGFWDLHLTYGWGVDYDYGYRVRQAGLINVLTNRARVTHKEHRSITNFSDFAERARTEMNVVLGQKYGDDWGRIMYMERHIVPLILSCDRDVSLTEKFVDSYRTVQSGLARPVVIIDTSHATRLSAKYFYLIAALHPAAIYVHPPEPQMDADHSVQEAVGFAFIKVLEETSEGDLILFIEDDIHFSAQFLERVRTLEIRPDMGMLTFYLPGRGYGSTVINPGHFYGTQGVLFPRRVVEEIVENWTEIQMHIPPGYDIRWSRFLSKRGYKIYSTEHSYVQHLTGVSRLHGHRTHVSNSFRG